MSAGLPPGGMNKHASSQVPGGRTPPTLQLSRTGAGSQCCFRIKSQAQAGCMRQVLGPGALGRPRGIGWRGRWEGGSGCEIHVNPWLIYVNVWQKPLQYCKVISLQLIKIKKKKKSQTRSTSLPLGIKKNVLFSESLYVQDYSWTMTGSKSQGHFRLWNQQACLLVGHI